MQRILEYTGPFRIGQRIQITPEVNSQIIHIGIQVPYKWAIAIPETNMNPDDIVPVSFVPDSWKQIEAPKPDISINRKEYCISPAGILEFDEMEMIEATIQILKDLPKESIIDIVLYERTME